MEHEIGFSFTGVCYFSLPRGERIRRGVILLRHTAAGDCARAALLREALSGLAEAGGLLPDMTSH